MEYKNIKLPKEAPDAADSRRSAYLDGINEYLKKKSEEAKSVRSDSFKVDMLKENPEYYRQEYLKMLGIDKIDFSRKPTESELIFEDKICKIHRLRVYITDEIPFYAMLFVPANAKNAPLVIAQHGGGGTPELCSDMNGKNNYNHMVLRALSRGAAVLAPQLLLWSLTESETMRAHDIPFDRAKLDSSLKRFGLSVTGLEIASIMKCIDYATTLEEIDQEKIAMVGISYGGYFTMHTMAIDTRIKAGYSAAVFNDRDVYDFPDWSYPSSAFKFQDAEVAALCAPRRLYIQIGKTDEVFTYTSALNEVTKAEKYFDEFGCKENFRFSLWDGGHTIPDSDDGFDFIFSSFK